MEVSHIIINNNFVLNDASAAEGRVIDSAVIESQRYCCLSPPWILRKPAAAATVASLACVYF